MAAEEGRCSWREVPVNMFPCYGLYRWPSMVSQIANECDKMRMPNLVGLGTSRWFSGLSLVTEVYRTSCKPD